MCGLNIASNVCLIDVSLILKSYEIHLLIFYLYAKLLLVLNSLWSKVHIRRLSRREWCCRYSVVRLPDECDGYVSRLVRWDCSRRTSGASAKILRTGRDRHRANSSPATATGRTAVTLPMEVSNCTSAFSQETIWFGLIQIYLMQQWYKCYSYSTVVRYLLLHTSSNLSKLSPVIIIVNDSEKVLPRGKSY